MAGAPSSPPAAGTKTEQDMLWELPWAAPPPALFSPAAPFPSLASLPHQLLCQHGQNKQVEVMDSMAQTSAETSEPAGALQCSPCFPDAMEQALSQQSPVQLCLCLHPEYDGPQLKVSLGVSCALCRVTSHPSNSQPLFSTGRSARCGSS